MGISEFTHFNFEIRNRPGKANAHADTLSRVPLSFEEYVEDCSEVVNRDVLNAVTSLIHETNSDQNAWLSSPAAVPDLLKEDCEDIATLFAYEIIAAQQEDPRIAHVLHFMQIRRHPTYQERQKEPAMARQLLHEWNNLYVAEDGILYHKSGSRNQIALPGKYHKRVYEELHDNMGHLGPDRVIELARQRFH